MATLRLGLKPGTLHHQGVGHDVGQDLANGGEREEECEGVVGDVE